MFRGTHEHAVDAKGRTSLPAKFREVLAEKYGAEQRLMITVSPDGAPCLRAYPVQEWAAIEEKLASASSFDPRVMELVRAFVGGANEVEVDKLGRVLVPQSMREHAGLVKNVAFVGALQHFEIWDSERFRGHRDRLFADRSLATALMELRV